MVAPKTREPGDTRYMPVKHSGVYASESINGLRRIMRKMGYSARREEIWHLVDTVDAMRACIRRYHQNWVPGTLLDTGFWVDRDEPPREPEKMTRDEQLIMYDRVVKTWQTI